MLLSEQSTACAEGQPEACALAVSRCIWRTNCMQQLKTLTKLSSCGDHARYRAGAAFCAVRHAEVLPDIQDRLCVCVLVCLPVSSCACVIPHAASHQEDSKYPRCWSPGTFNVRFTSHGTEHAQSMFSSAYAAGKQSIQKPTKCMSDNT